MTVGAMANRMVDTVSPDELATRRRILESLQGYAHPRRPNVVQAGEFQAVLDSMGLRFGTDVVDRVMLLCNIDGAGMVRPSAASLAAGAATSDRVSARVPSARLLMLWLVC